jgi:glutamate/tyrosine decarboxylase-like PLP-dependent enzyme
MDPETFRALGHDLVDRIAGFLESLPRRRVTAAVSPGEVRDLLDAAAPLPETGRDPAQLLATTAHLLFDQSLHNGHPRFLGYITSSAAPMGMLAELLAASVNPNVGAWTLSPVASEIEAQTVRWTAELLGLDPGSGGLLVSGGNMANTVAFWAARVRAAGDAVRQTGSGVGGRMAVYVSAETHTWIQKAADLSGVGTDAIRWIPTGEDLCLDVDALRKAIDRDLEDGMVPMMVVGTAGSVSTGAVDDLPAIAAICRERDIWFHVDGAYGAPAAVLPDAPEPLHHLGLADSVAVDPHKWLYAPLEAGCVLVKDPESLRKAFAYHPPYYHFGVEATNFVDLGPQNSRGFRALKVWLALQQVGREGYLEMIADDVAMARLLHTRVEAHPEFEAHTLGLSISTFRYVPPELRGRVGEPDAEAYLNALNKALQARLEAGGEVFLSNAVVRGRYLLRGCVVNFRTGDDDVAAIPEIVAREGARVHAELRDP